MMSEYRAERLAVLIKEELGDILQKSLRTQGLVLLPSPMSEFRGT